MTGVTSCCRGLSSSSASLPYTTYTSSPASSSADIAQARGVTVAVLRP
eukprot:CAMPEP_0171109178 /NCGR_PEP_ID=MMETSP0766_2-20121228/70469_1 /TAXON_ID=439317 /ORGANISM="Gambierdiscus australes, Strain CAWD 149" /LENGTH=47 /DNA_ID= /DNA_START= /DNA_END= /DNA_ORIENTATION=